MSLCAILSGGWIAVLNNHGWSGTIANLGGWIIGAMLFAIRPMCQISPQFRQILCLICLAILALSFVGTPQENVHRWLTIGPISFNCAALVLPIMLALLMPFQGNWFGCGVLVGLALLLWRQPDVSQASALAAASLLTLPNSNTRWRVGVGLTTILALASWFQLDSMKSVAMVEDIITVGLKSVPAIGALAVVALIGTSIAPYFSMQSTEQKTSGAVISVYFATCCIATLFGHYPVPLTGFGVSFPLGWWLGYCALHQKQVRYPLAVQLHSS